MKIYDEIDLQIRTQKENVFIIGESRIKEAYLASEAELANDSLYEWDSILKGVLSLSLKRGVDTYTGAYALPIANVGTLHVRSTNQSLDPSVYKYLQPRSKVRLVLKNDGNTVTIFQGRVDNIYIDYRSDQSKPIISFDVMDPIAELQATMTKLSGISSSSKQTWSERITEILSNGGRTATEGPTQTQRAIYGGITTHGFWEDNRTIWEALTLASDTEGGFIYFDKDNVLQCYASDNIPDAGPTMFFSNTDPAAVNYGFKNISVDYNTASIINQVQVTNAYGDTVQSYVLDAIGTEYGHWETSTVIKTEAKGPYEDQGSVNKYGAHAMNIKTNFDLNVGEGELSSWADKIISKWKNPSTLIKEIEWDAKNDSFHAASMDLLDVVDIEYSTDKVSLNKELSVIGIQMEISADQDTWRVKYILFPRSRFI